MLEKKEFQGVNYVQLRTQIMGWLEENPHIRIMDIVETKSQPKKLTPIITTIGIYYADFP